MLALLVICQTASRTLQYQTSKSELSFVAHGGEKPWNFLVLHSHDQLLGSACQRASSPPHSLQKALSS